MSAVGLTCVTTNIYVHHCWHQGTHPIRLGGTHPLVCGDTNPLTLTNIQVLDVFSSTEVLALHGVMYLFYLPSNMVLQHSLASR